MRTKLLVLLCAMAMLLLSNHATAERIANPVGTSSAHDHQAAYAAYADILDEYHDFMFYRESAQQDLDEGKVALRDVYGDDTPELLFIYRKHEGAENLRIYTYTEDKGATVLFDDMICSFAAGGGNYCVFISAEGALMAYCSLRDTHYEWGFWDVNQMLNTGRDGGQSVPFQYEAETAALYYDLEMDGEEKPALRMREGRMIPEAEFDSQAKAMLSGIQTVLFQSDLLEFDNFDGTYTKAGLYDIEPVWRDVPRFTADFMIWEVARNTLCGYGIEVREDISTYEKDGKTYTLYAGVLLGDRFYHEDRNEWITYYYVEIGEGQYKHLTGEAPAPSRPIEIQVYSTEHSLDRYLGKFIEFGGESFEANTVYHRRDIVFEIRQLFVGGSLV